MKQQLIYYWQLMRFHKPIGIYLLLWPTLWGVWTASHGHPSLKILLIFIFGTILMRAAGCVINDIADRHFDKYVARTRERPLTAGNITLRNAIILFLILISITFILVCQLNILTIALSFIGLGLAILYPFSKRFTHWPQFILGLAFSWGIPLSFSAQHQPLGLTCWLLFTASTIFALIYDTEYALVDKEDDIKIGIKSTAILFGNRNPLILGLLQILMLGLLILFGLIIKATLFYYLSLLGASLLFIYQQYLLHTKQTVAYFNAFLNNHWAGLLIFAGIILAHL